jgi:predicted O-linked N-acetylglucosamine transferase (SPINDLY family)
MLQALDQRPEVGLVYADVIKTETENETFDRCTPTGRYRWYDWDRNLLLTEGCFMGPQPMWRKSVHEVYGVFDASLVSSGDFEFWLRISQTFDFYHIREPLGLYLVRPDSVEHRNRELKRAEDIQILAVYRRAASSGEILRCVPLDALKQALCQTSCGPNDHLGEIISQIEMLAGLNQYLQNASAGSHWSAADRIVQLKEQILRSHPPAEMVKEFIDLALELMLNQTSWFSRHRENQGTRNGQSSLSAVKTADRQGRGDMGRLRDSNSTTGENIKAKPHWGSSSIARPEPSPDANGKLTRLRNEMAQFWLRVPASDLAQTFSGEAGNLHRELTFGRLKGLPASRDEVQAAQGLLGQAEKGLHEEGLARFLLVEMLYRSPQHLPPRIDLLGVPEWLRCDYTQFLLTCSGFLKEPGESEAYFDCLDQLTGCLCDAIRKEPQSPTWQRIALLFAEKANFIPLYFSRRNLKAIYIRRAEIVDYTLRLRKCDCDYAIPPRPIGRAKLRLGIHCRSLRPQPEVFATLPVFESLDREKFEIFFYVHSCNGSPLEERVRRATDKFTVLPEAIKPCAEIIRADDLDILFFGNNITAVHNQSFVLANYRMARVQCIHFCNPVTSGKRHIDHFLLGQLIVGKQELKERFAEKILTIDGSGICFDIPEFVEAPEQRLSRMDLGIGNGKTVFVSGANCYKIIPELRHTWAKILKQVPESVLVLYPFGPAWSDAYPKQLLVEDMIRVFAGYGLLSNRLIVLDTLGGKEDILALNRIADVYLDAVPYSGATSLLEPLQVGIPPVVADRRELRFSQGAAMIRELGIHELIARDEEDYIRIAVRLGSDTCLREEMRGRIQRQMAAGPDFLNPRLYAQRIGRVFRSLFQDLDRLSGRDSNLKKPDIPTQEVTTCYT